MTLNDLLNDDDNAEAIAAILSTHPQNQQQQRTGQNVIADFGYALRGHLTQPIENDNHDGFAAQQHSERLHDPSVIHQQLQRAANPELSYSHGIPWQQQPYMRQQDLHPGLSEYESYTDNTYYQ